MNAEGSLENEMQPLDKAPIIEAVLDVDCDMPTGLDLEALDAQAKQVLGDSYPVSKRQFVSEHQITAGPNVPPNVSIRQGWQSLQYVSQDEKQLVQVRKGGYSFNRLAPYGSLDEYLPEMERTWRLFVAIAAPVSVRLIRLRYINRIELPLLDGRVSLDDYLRLAPHLPDEDRLTFVAFFNQHSALEAGTGNQVNIVFATQPLIDGALPIIFDIEAFKGIDLEPLDWGAISFTIQSLRSLKNRVFKNSLTPACLNLFQR